jgi:hypothetical protein
LKIFNKDLLLGLDLQQFKEEAKKFSGLLVPINTAHRSKLDSKVD